MMLIQRASHSTIVCGQTRPRRSSEAIDCFVEILDCSPGFSARSLRGVSIQLQFPVHPPFHAAIEPSVATPVNTAVFNDGCTVHFVCWAMGRAPIPEIGPGHAAAAGGQRTLAVFSESFQLVQPAGRSDAGAEGGTAPPFHDTSSQSARARFFRVDVADGHQRPVLHVQPPAVIGPGALVVQQLQFSVEAFLRNYLNTQQADARDFEFDNVAVTLIDFDSQLISVEAHEHGNVGMAILVRGLTLPCNCISGEEPATRIEFVVGVDVSRAAVSILSTSAPVVVRARSLATKETVSAASKLRKANGPQAAADAHHARFLSNHALFSGKSLQYLRHPSQPLAIIL